MQIQFIFLNKINNLFAKPFLELITRFFGLLLKVLFIPSAATDDLFYTIDNKENYLKVSLENVQLLIL